MVIADRPQLFQLFLISHNSRAELTSQVTEWSELTQGLWSRLTSWQVNTEKLIIYYLYSIALYSTLDSVL